MGRQPSSRTDELKRRGYDLKDELGVPREKIPEGCLLQECKRNTEPSVGPKDCRTATRSGYSIERRSMTA